jgi:hypothetical protein
LAAVSIDVPDPSDKTYINENRRQRTIKRSILPSAYIYIKLIKNKDNFIPAKGYDFGRFLARLSGSKVEIGDIVDTENCIYYKMTDTKIAEYNDMVVIALQDLIFFSSVNGVKTTNFINALEQGY